MGHRLLGMGPGLPGDVYGLFTANAAFISQNFAGQTIGTGAAPGLDDYGNGSQEVAVLLIGLDHQGLRHSRWGSHGSGTDSTLQLPT